MTAAPDEPDPADVLALAEALRQCHFADPDDDTMAWFTHDPNWCNGRIDHWVTAESAARSLLVEMAKAQDLSTRR